MTRILSVIIPAWNEGKVIYSNIKRIDETLNQLFEKYGYSYEIILVNDGSIDNTYNEAMRAAKNNKKIKVINYKDNGGKGFALKYGFKFCSGNFVTFIDADLDLHPKRNLLLI
jgi:glycosyltransferase involved in cell wall biosynthesis